MSTKTCKTCGEEKSLESFHRSPSNRDGRNTECSVCRKKKAARKYKEDWFRMTVVLKRSYCKKNGIPFDLDEDYLKGIWTDCCPVLGEPFVRHEKKNDRSPALDRIDPKLGYVKGNVKYISARANRIKYDASVEELRKVLDYMEGATTIPQGSTLK